MKNNKKEFWIKSASKNLYCLFEKPENAKNRIILLLHGLTNDHLNCPLIDNTVKRLHKIGLSTFRFDYFGSGKSEGKFIDKSWKIMIQNTTDILNFIKKKLKYKKIGIWGRSVGAILGATICDDISIYASVLLSITIHTSISFSASFPKNQSFSFPIKGTAIVKGKPILKKEFYEKTKWIDEIQKDHLKKAKNILIFQGTKDKTVYNPTWAREIYDLVNKPKKLLYIKNADHAYSSYENKTINETIKWFKELSLPK